MEAEYSDYNKSSVHNGLHGKGSSFDPFHLILIVKQSGPLKFDPAATTGTHSKIYNNISCFINFKNPNYLMKKIR